MNTKGRSQTIIAGFLIASLAMVTLVIAGDSANDTITASVSLGNTGPTVNSVGVQTPYNPTTNSTTAIAINMTVTDIDGWTNINISAGASYCNVSLSGTIRQLGTCSKISNSSSTTAIFQCTGLMNYYDLSGNWATVCRAIDNSASYSDLAGATMVYNRLESIDITAGTAVSWPGLTQSSTNTGATGDPVVVANYGNAHFNNLNITAFNLLGATNASAVMFASDFTANVADASEGSALANATSKVVATSALLIGSGTTEDVYLYLEQISNAPLQAQSYSASSPWVLTVWNATNT